MLDTGTVDDTATVNERDSHRAVRRERSSVSGGADGTKLDVATGRRLDDNLVEVSEDGPAVIACRHCGERLGEPNSLRLGLYEGPTTDAGPQILTDPADYVDATMAFRQYCCPGCWTAIHSAIVPTDHMDHVGPPNKRILPSGR